MWKDYCFLFHTFSFLLLLAVCEGSVSKSRIQKLYLSALMGYIFQITNTVDSLFMQGWQRTEPEGILHSLCGSPGWINYSCWNHSQVFQLWEQIHHWELTINRSKDSFKVSIQWWWKSCLPSPTSMEAKFTHNPICGIWLHENLWFIHQVRSCSCSQALTWPGNSIFFGDFILPSFYIVSKTHGGCFMPYHIIISQTKGL